MVWIGWAKNASLAGRWLVGWSQYVDRSIDWSVSQFLNALVLLVVAGDLEKTNAATIYVRLFHKKVRLPTDSLFVSKAWRILIVTSTAHCVWGDKTLGKHEELRSQEQQHSECGEMTRENDYSSYEDIHPNEKFSNQSKEPKTNKSVHFKCRFNAGSSSANNDYNWKLFFGNFDVF